MARLIYVPIMHSDVEMGSAESAYKAAFLARFGEAKWQERCAEVDAIWNKIKAMIMGLGLDMTKVKLFQDSLPVCGKEKELMHDLAVQGSRNHQLLENLVGAGAELIGTESSALLLEEYRLLQDKDRKDDAAAELLERRDRFVAERINAELADDEIGLLFMGALHRVARFLPARFKVEYLAVRG